jgi:hypothetical protein
MLDESAEGLSEDDRELIENVRQYGFHWFSVGQSEKDRANFPEWSKVPGWSYTIGLHVSYGHPEIVVFELEDDITGALFWDLAESIKAGNRFEPGQIYDDVLPSFEGQRFTFEQVSPGWIPSLFGFGSWFYKHEDFPFSSTYGRTVRGSSSGRTAPRRRFERPSQSWPNRPRRKTRRQPGAAKQRPKRPGRAKVGQKFGPRPSRLDAERARVRALWKLPGLDSNQQPSG